VVTSAEIEAQLAPTLQRLGLPTGMLEDLSGIVERRVNAAGTMPSEVAAEAGELALARSGVAREDIGILINTSVCRDYLEPSTASLAHGLMGLPAEAMNFDLGNACLGFLNGMNVVASHDRARRDRARPGRQRRDEPLHDGDHHRPARLRRLRRGDVPRAVRHADPRAPAASPW
jgi:3-oxoacyl-[acyl-carrier-protein] synthase III